MGDGPQKSFPPGSTPGTLKFTKVRIKGGGGGGGGGHMASAGAVEAVRHLPDHKLLACVGVSAIAFTLCKPQNILMSILYNTCGLELKLVKLLFV